MPRRPTAARRWLTAASWPVGVGLTSWNYMWRSTPLHRREVPEAGSPAHLPPEFPQGVDESDLQHPEGGYGPLFHRRYRTRIREAEVGPEQLMAVIKEKPNRAAPTKFARFQKVLGDPGRMDVGDEYVVRMPGPWDGPVRVISSQDCSFRLATLTGHLEAGQIEFRVASGELIAFEIESWARSADRIVDLLYSRVRMAKEIQLHMWISFLEGVVSLSGGRMTGGIEIDTRRIDSSSS
ncbi:MAG: DUF1990 family protein [Solirubrobacterales bacterium]|nr:DUF1990 family protein [Solirubrobacterales bacterium]